VLGCRVLPSPARPRSFAERAFQEIATAVSRRSMLAAGTPAIAAGSISLARTSCAENRAIPQRLLSFHRYE